MLRCRRLPASLPPTALSILPVLLGIELPLRLVELALRIPDILAEPCFALVLDAGELVGHELVPHGGEAAPLGDVGFDDGEFGADGGDDVVEAGVDGWGVEVFVDADGLKRKVSMRAIDNVRCEG